MIDIITPSMFLWSYCRFSRKIKDLKLNSLHYIPDFMQLSDRNQKLIVSAMRPYESRDFEIVSYR